MGVYMRKNIYLGLGILVLLFTLGCYDAPTGSGNDKDINTTVLVDTVIDTITVLDSLKSDMVFILDTLIKSDTVFVVDTLINSDTLFIVDTLIKTDTIIVLDTVIEYVTPINGLGMKLIPSKGESFTMAFIEGGVSQEVSLTYNFYMESTEVTQKSFSDVMSDPVNGFNDYVVPGWSSEYGLGDNYPSYHINWFDAALYCNARSKAEGRDTVYNYSGVTGTTGQNVTLLNVQIDLSKNGFRLPTEAEWEFACRGGTTTNYFWGDTYIDDYAWHLDNSDNTSHEVATKKPNSYGIYDITGNIWEWSNDWFGDYSSTLITDPSGPATGSRRVNRGGCWRHDTTHLFSGYRTLTPPEYSSNSNGFRVVHF
jgi:formylglycine-generating enzyme required for sulfatase activity